MLFDIKNATASEEFATMLYWYELNTMQAGTALGEGKAKALNEANAELRLKRNKVLDYVADLEKRLGIIP